ncbi:hypothetical protein M0R36_09035 [bacterium]|jgi:hypothetical protein|nr:hypothetical protein [bacterium]
MQINKVFIFCVILSFLLPVFAEETTEANFILYISNQSFDVNPVDIKIYIDGKLVVNQDFDVTGNRVPQHNWQKFEFNLSIGSHRLFVSSKKGDATLEKEFEISKKHWAVVDYWYYPKVTGGAGPTPKSFSFHIQDEQIRFK